MNSDRPTSQVTPRGAQPSESDLAPAIRRRDLDRRWLVHWIVVVTAAEALGFVAPAIVGVATADSPWSTPLLLLAGAVEGALLGAGQAVVLHRRVDRLRRTVWVGLTVAGALLAYFAGLVPSTFAETWTQWPWPAQAVLLAGVAVVLLLSIGTAQWLELRRHVPRAGWWILGTAAAWLLALGLFLAIATPLWHEGQDAAVAVLVGVCAGFVMATVMATVTGLVLISLTGPWAQGRSARRRTVVT